jgi:hypothetical protein
MVGHLRRPLCQQIDRYARSGLKGRAAAGIRSVEAVGLALDRGRSARRMLIAA